MPKIRFFIAAALYVCSVSIAVADDDDGLRVHLKGLRGVGVVIESPQPDVEQAGLTKADMQTDVELRLRLAGITVLSQEQQRSAPGAPFLYVHVVVNSKPTSSVWSYVVMVNLMENVTLERSPETSVVASTFSLAGVSAIRKEDVRQIRDYVKDYVDRFINADLAMNPKK